MVDQRTTRSTFYRHPIVRSQSSRTSPVQVLTRPTNSLRGSDGTSQSRVRTLVRYPIRHRSATHTLRPNIPRTLWTSFADLIASLGGTSGGNGGGNGGNMSMKLSREFDGDQNKFATYVIDAFINRTCRFTCTKVCRTMRFRVNPDLVERAGINFVRALDQTIRAEYGMSLSSFLYTQLTGIMHRYRVPQPELLLQSSRLIQYDVTRGVRLRVLEYVLTQYVYYYLPDTISFGSVANINSYVFKPFRKEVITFLQGKQADLGPIFGACLKLISKRYAIDMVSPLCHICKKLCHKSRRV